MKNQLRALFFLTLSLLAPIAVGAQSYGIYGQNVQIAQPTLPPLGPGSSTIGSIGNTAFGITGSLPAGSNNIGVVSLFLPYSSVPFPTATQTPAANTAIVEACPVAVPTAVASGQVIPITCSPTNGGINLGPLTATVGEPYSMITQGQTALQSSGIGILGVYNSTLPTLTTGQVAPSQEDSSGRLYVNASNTAFGTSAITGLGATRYNILSTTTSTTAQGICSAACTAYALSAINSGTSACYLNEFNVASGSVTAGTTVPVRLMLIPATSEVADNLPPTVGEAFSTAWSYTLTTTPSGTTGCTGTVYVQGDYK